MLCSQLAYHRILEAKLNLHSLMQFCAKLGRNWPYAIYEKLQRASKFMILIETVVSKESACRNNVTTWHTGKHCELLPMLEVDSVGTTQTSIY